MSAAVVNAGLYEQVWLGGRLEEHLDAVYGNGSAAPPELTELRSGAPLTYTKLELARAAARVSRATGRGGGTTAPGRLLLRIAPRAMVTLAGRLPGGITLVSATNGKTTTARMLAGILEAAGRTVVHNRAGANTHWGVGAALAEAEGDVGVFEVDEAWLPLLCAQLQPRLIVLGNLFRDRLDGYGELERLVALWRDLLGGPAAPAAVVANADDPLLSGPGGVLDGSLAMPILFGMGDGRVGSPRPEHPNEAHSCAVCDSPLGYTRAYLGHLGHYRCANCDVGRPEPAVRALAVREGGLEEVSATVAHPGGAFPVRLTLPGLHNVYNALAATAAAVHLGVAPGVIRAGLESVSPPFGRAEAIRVDGCRVHLFLIKNPVGANAVLRLLGADGLPRSLHLWLGLNDQEADGRDVSWIWDVDFERLAGRVARVSCSGRRAEEMALRLKYAGWLCPVEVQPDLDASFRSAVASAPESLVALPTYTALLGLRGVLNRRGLAVSDWQRTARAA